MRKTCYAAGGAASNRWMWKLPLNLARWPPALRPGCRSTGRRRLGPDWGDACPEEGKSAARQLIWEPRRRPPLMNPIQIRIFTLICRMGHFMRCASSVVIPIAIRARSPSPASRLWTESNENVRPMHPEAKSRGATTRSLTAVSESAF